MWLNRPGLKILIFVHFPDDQHRKYVWCVAAPLLPTSLLFLEAQFLSNYTDVRESLTGRLAVSAIPPLVCVSI